MDGYTPTLIGLSAAAVYEAVAAVQAYIPTSEQKAEIDAAAAAMTIAERLAERLHDFPNPANDWETEQIEQLKQFYYEVEACEEMRDRVFELLISEPEYKSYRFLTCTFKVQEYSPKRIKPVQRTLDLATCNFKDFLTAEGMNYEIAERIYLHLRNVELQSRNREAFDF